MRLSHVDERRAVFSGRRRARSPLLIGLAFVVVAAGPLVVAPSMEPVRVVTALLSFGLAAVFIRAGFPVSRRVELSLDTGVLKTGGGESLLEAPRTLVLSSEEDEDDVPLYRVFARLANGDKALLLSDPRPDVVLRDLGRLLAHAPLRVEAGWGLPSDATPWSSDRSASAGNAASGAHGAPREIGVARPFPSRREIGLTILGFGAAVASLMAVEVVARLRHGDQPLVQDLVLPSVTSVVVLLFGVAVLTRSTRLTGNGSLSIEQRIFGFGFRRVVIRRGSIRGAHPVGPPGKPLHMLIDTDTGPVAIRCADRNAGEIAAAITRAR